MYPGWTVLAFAAAPPASSFAPGAALRSSCGTPDDPREPSSILLLITVSAGAVGRGVFSLVRQNSRSEALHVL